MWNIFLLRFLVLCGRRQNTPTLAGDIYHLERVLIVHKPLKFLILDNDMLSGREFKPLRARHFTDPCFSVTTFSGRHA